MPEGFRLVRDALGFYGMESIEPTEPVVPEVEPDLDPTEDLSALGGVVVQVGPKAKPEPKRRGRPKRGAKL